jgi:hypothetical protein
MPQKRGGSAASAPQPSDKGMTEQVNGRFRHLQGTPDESDKTSTVGNGNLTRHRLSEILWAWKHGP